MGWRKSVHKNPHQLATENSSAEAAPLSMWDLAIKVKVEITIIQIPQPFLFSRSWRGKRRKEKLQVIPVLFTT